MNAAKIYVDKVPSNLNCSDLGTKAVAPVELFEFLRDRVTGYDTDTFVSPTVQDALNGVLMAWGGHGPVSWTGRATAESLSPTGPDFKVYQNRGVFLAKWKKRG